MTTRNAVLRLHRLLLGVALGAALLIATGARADAVPDAWITTQVRASLLTTDGFSSGRIHVDTIDGRVTLYGTVNTDAQRTSAEAVARRVNGTVSVRNLLQVRAPLNKAAGEVADKAIRGNVERVLKADPTLQDSQIAVKSVDAGVVLLSGNAASLSDHVRALQDAGRTDGVRRVASEIKSPDHLADAEISREGLYDPKIASRSAAADMWTTTAVKLRLLASGDASGFDINVDTEDGVVTLFGVVDSEREKAVAEKEARKVDGARGVHNELQVVAPSKQKAVARSDDAVQLSVQQRLAANAGLTDCRFTVEVKNGVARVGGNVKGQLDHLVALTTVSSTPGVHGLIDELQIGNGSAR